MKKILATVITVTLASSLMLAQASRSAEVEFRAAQHKEEVVGDFKGAIDQYKKIAQGKDRALAARALLRMASLYQKLGDAEAQKMYERLVREFGEQKEAVAMARARLASASTAVSRARQSLWTPPSSVSIFGKVSPDGRFLPYLDGGMASLMLRDLATGASRQIVPPFSAGNVTEAQYPESAVFSRNGKQLAYSWRVRQRDIYQLRVVSVQDTGVPTPEVVLDNPDVSWLAPYDWTPDGNAIAVVLHRQDKSAAIGFVSIRTGAFEQLKSLNWDSVSNMALSPAGDFLAFDLRGQDRSHDIEILPVDGSGGATAVSYTGDDTLVGWSPDGARLLFVSDRSGSVDLWSIPIIKGKPTGDAVQLLSNVGRFWPAGVTRDGTVVAAVEAVGAAQLKIADFNFEAGGGPKAGVVEEFIGPGTLMRWSHDGSSLATAPQWLGLLRLTPQSRQGSLRLNVRTVGTDEPKTVVSELQYANDLEWAPDNLSLIVAGGDLRGRTGLFTVDISSGRTTPIALTDGEQVVMPKKWRAVVEGRLYYDRYPVPVTIGRSRFIEHDLTTGREREVLRRTPASDTRLDSWSVRAIVGVTPEREVLYITHDRPDVGFGLRLMSIDGTNDRELMRALATDTLTVMDRLPGTDDLLVARTNEEKRSEVWRVPLRGSGSATRLLTTTEDLSTFLVLGAKDIASIYLGKAGTGRFDLWRLSAGGSLVAIPSVSEAVPGKSFPKVELSPNRQQIAFFSQYQIPSVPLEVLAFEGILKPRDR